MTIKLKAIEINMTNYTIRLGIASLKKDKETLTLSVPLEESELCYGKRRIILYKILKSDNFGSLSSFANNMQYKTVLFLNVSHVSWPNQARFVSFCSMNGIREPPI